MAPGQPETYLDHPLFRQAQQNAQKGEWQAGLDKMEKLMQAYPLEADLRALRQEMQLRARIDQDERRDIAQARKQRVRDLLMRMIIVAGLAVLALAVVRSYSAIFQEQIAVTRAKLEYQVREVEMAVKFRDAQDFLNAGRADTALALITEVAALDPNYPGLAELKAQAQRLQTLDVWYAEAMSLIEQGDTPKALAVLREIEREEPYYRDVKLQISNLESLTQLSAILAQADSAYEAGDWETAIAAYEELYLYHPDYQSVYVEERLFASYVKAAEARLRASDSLEAILAAEEYYRKSLALRPQDAETKAQQAQVRAMVEERLFLGYIQAAQAALAAEPDSLQALRLADQYFTEALKLRPNDAEIGLQRELAHRFIEAQEYFNQGNWTAVIDTLEFVYRQDKGYARGTARQSLYEAYVARGDGAMAIGDFDGALSDYRRAAVIAEEDPSSKLRLYEVQLKVAEAMGVLGEYQNAVLLYASAISMVDLQARAQDHSAAMATALADAERYASQGDYKAAFRSYREAVSWGTETFEIVEYTVVSGDYLSSLAIKFGSTVSLIAEANNLDDPNLIITGQVLLIPILP